MRLSGSRAAFRQLEFHLHQRLHRIQHGTVDVIDQVQRREHEQRSSGIEFRRRHLAWEYNTAARSSARSVCYRLTLLAIHLNNADNNAQR